MFNSPESALRFAFSMQGKEIVSKQSYKQRVDGHTPQGVAMTVWDFHAQGAMIMGFVERLGLLDRAWVYLEFGSEAQQDIAVKIVAEKLGDDPSVARVARNKSEIVAALRIKSVRKLASSIGVSKYKAWKIRGAVEHAVYPIGCQVLDLLWEHMNHKQ